VINAHVRESILATLERLNSVFIGQLDDEELTIGLQRVTVPNIDSDAFREVIVNAFAHRDYARLGTVRVTWYPDALEISNPGGLVDGVSVSNILTAPPTPRNFALADALKRLGLAERSGRGVDRIFEGQVRYGRLPPDYSGTTPTQVVVRLQRGPADRAFVSAIAEYEIRTGGRLPVPETIALAALRRTGRLSTAELAVHLQVSESRARLVADDLVAAHLALPHGRTRAHFYTLSEHFLAALGAPRVLSALAGLSEVEQEATIISMASTGQRITRAAVTQRCGLTGEQAKYRLRRMVEDGLLKKAGKGPATHYLLA
jgi:ATP-dependent DNA helicase RecG